MTPDAAVLALGVEFAAQLGTAAPGALVQYEASGRPAGLAPTSRWVRFGARPLVELLDALGDPRLFRSSGLITMQCFTPMQKGRGPSDAFAVALAHIFRGRTDIGPGIRIGDIRYVTHGESEGFFQQNVLIDYEVDDLD